MADDGPLTAREVADQSGIPLRTFQRWVREGRVRHLRKLDGTTGPYLFDRSVLAELGLGDPKPAA